MADTTFLRGSYERYNANPSYLSRCREPESVKQAAEDEKAWARVIDAHGDKHRPATFSENTKKHFDVVQFINNKEIKYEVKGPKAIKRLLAKQDRRLLVERRWVYESEAHFFCFRKLDGSFLVVPIRALQSLLDKKGLDWEKPTLYPSNPTAVKNNVAYIRPNQSSGQGANQSAFVWVDAAELESIGETHGESSQAAGTSN